MLGPRCRIAGLNDSKLLTVACREELARAIRARAQAWALACVGVRRIESINIRAASFEAMRRALARLGLTPGCVLVDGYAIPDLDLPQEGVIHGDRRICEIAAASILAKVARDRMMANFARLFPGYGFDRHKGYGTAAHLAALRRLGPCPCHRRTFGPVQEALAVPRRARPAG